MAGRTQVRGKRCKNTVTSSQQLCGEGLGLGQGKPLLAHSASGSQGCNTQTTTKERANSWRPAWLLLDMHAEAPGAPERRLRGAPICPGHYSSPHSTGRPQGAGGAGVEHDWEDRISIRSRHWFSEDSTLLKDKPRNTKLSKHNTSKSSPRALLNSLQYRTGTHWGPARSKLSPF